MPFVSKATGLPLAKIAARCMAGRSLDEQGVGEERVPAYYSVKEAVFPFTKFPTVDPMLGPEMKSTGEVMGVGYSFGEAFGKAQLASGTGLPTAGQVVLTIRDADKPQAPEVARRFIEAGFTVLATEGTAQCLRNASLECQVVKKVKEGRPHIVDMIKNGEIQFVVNTAQDKRSVEESRSIRMTALRYRVAYFTTMAGALASCDALPHLAENSVHALQALHAELD